MKKSTAPLSSKNPSSYKPLNKKDNVSAMLEKETLKMEEKLDLVKKMMEMEKDKRSNVSKSGEGTMWRGATTKKGGLTKGYGDAVVTNHKKN